MSWEPTLLGNNFEIKHGYAFKGQYFSSFGRYIVLTPGNFFDEGGFKHRLDHPKYYSIDPPEEFILQKGDLIIAMTEQAEGLLGSSALVPESNLYLHNQRLGLVINLNEKALNKQYLYYLMNTREVRSQIRASATGLKVKHTAPKRILDVKVKLPEIEIQTRIASILSAYDDLIENNTRRIALLEESMHRLYREWFVRLRFPGHERVKLVDGLPEGWERKTLGDIIILNYGKGLIEDARVSGDFPVYGSSGIVGFHNEALVTGPTIIVGRKGTVGSVYWSSKDCFPIDTVYYINSEQTSPYTFLNLQHQHFVSSDVAVPGLNRKHAYAQPFLVPNNLLLDQFNDMVGSLIRQVEVLKASSSKLAEARDLLLPRLMSGEIKV